MLLGQREQSYIYPAIAASALCYPFPATKLQPVNRTGSGALLFQGSICELIFKVVFMKVMKTSESNCFLLAIPVGTIYKPSKQFQTKNYNELVQNKWKEVMAVWARQHTFKHHPV